MPIRSDRVFRRYIRKTGPSCFRNRAVCRKHYRRRPPFLYFRPLVLSEQLRDLGVELLLLGWVLDRVPPLYELVDLLLEDLRLCFGLFRLTDVVFIVHRKSLMRIRRIEKPDLL